MLGRTGTSITTRVFAMLLLAATLGAPGVAKEDSAAAIRAARAAFNRAIMAGDLAAIDAVISDNIQVMRGTSSTIVSGRVAQLEFWRQVRLGERPEQYQRKPTGIELSRIAPMALERGTWRGGTLASAKNWASGSYVAKWRKIEGTWRIESEVYMTIACGGTLCPKN